MLLYGGKSTDRFWNENKPEPFGGEKCVDFFQTDFASDSVSLPRLDTDGCMSDTPETMGGLSGVPNGASSQTI